MVREWGDKRRTGGGRKEESGMESEICRTKKRWGRWEVRGWIILRLSSKTRHTAEGQRKMRFFPQRFYSPIWLCVHTSLGLSTVQCIGAIMAYCIAEMCLFRYSPDAHGLQHIMSPGTGQHLDFNGRLKILPSSKLEIKLNLFLYGAFICDLKFNVNVSSVYILDLHCFTFIPFAQNSCEHGKNMCY